ncbi:MAG: SDR family oxidoreductase [Planctomycetota bacterium]|jgi:NAD(P)-dependent dehydrogenase (short-subunit alcohol dehydrogenase family)
MNKEKQKQNAPKRVLITGCSSGFGLLTAVGAAKLGYDVIATMRNLDKVGPLQNALDAQNVSAQIEKLDVTDPDSINRLAQKIGHVDVLVNNAGILITGSFLDQTDEEMRQVFETNYFGIVNLTKVFTHGMITQESGRIINIASLAGLIGHPFNAAYSASKHALIGFTKSIRVELAPFGIDVISIEPGYHKTEIIRVNANQSANFYDRRSPMFQWNRGFLKAFLDEIVPRAGEPQPVVDKVLTLLASEKPKPHYVIGKDAKFAMILRWLGLGRWLEKQVYRKIRQARRLENKREAEKKARRKQKKNQSQ